MVCSHKDKIMPDYAAIDDHTILSYIFYPRVNFSISPKWGFDVFVTVEEGAVVHCRFYKEDNTWPWILHFHGNGEVVSDYDELSLFYLKNGLNLVVADYRGYGKSTGEPSLANLVHDSHIIYRAVVQELSERGFNEAL
ncbi:MAG TPA: alpha/beta hydrolase, partial [Syntrophorhabdaceae bacterium]|nr:alpha/beta hydrolase [Syntrophorhabdaceae bacterium]